MNIKQEYRHVKAIISQGSDLLMLRTRMLVLDLQEQLSGLVGILAGIAIAAISALVALLALMFGLNAVLPPQAKIWVFFGIALLGIVIAAVLLLRIPGTLKRNSNRLGQTLQDMQDDLFRLRGQYREQLEDNDRV